MDFTNLYLEISDATSYSLYNGFNLMYFHLRWFGALRLGARPNHVAFWVDS